MRVVAWVSPQERKALKRIAIEADSSVAELIRSLAGGLDKGVITYDELLHQVRKGAEVMEKIPTIFDRGENFKVVNHVREGCEWVFEGEGTATEKVDGTNVRLTIRAHQCVRVEKRRNPTKVQKKNGIIDGWSETEQKVESYVAGSWGPTASSLLLDRDGRAWHTDD